MRTLEPLVRGAHLGSLTQCRSGIYAIDDSIVQLVERRAAIVATVQDHKAQLGQPQRDMRREREVMTRLASRTARLGTDGVAVLMRAIIDICLDASGVDESIPVPDRDRMLA